jgi:IS5 family transposase
MTADLGDPQTISQLEQLNAVIAWKKLALPIHQTYQNDTARGGRPNVSVVMMLKILMLQKWFNLSDPGAEAMLRDRISFRKFVGLGWTDPTANHATIALFRKCLHEQQLVSDLFDVVTDHLTKQGLIVREGTLVDATIIAAPRGRNSDADSNHRGHTKDKTATSTKKHDTPHHGFKAHIATDTHKASSSITSTTSPRFTTANRSMS